MPGLRPEPLAPGRYTPAFSLPAEKESVSMKLDWLVALKTSLLKLPVDPNRLGATVDPVDPKPVVAVDPNLLLPNDDPADPAPN